jgi:hypothetical protein
VTIEQAAYQLKSFELQFLANLSLADIAPSGKN